MTSEHPVTYWDASGPDRSVVDARARYEELIGRDLMARSITTLKARGEWSGDRHPAPEDYPPLTLAEHLELLANGEVMARYYRHPSQVDRAVKAGASWDQIAAATGTTAEAARAAYREWAEGQHQYAGMGDAEYAAAIEAAGEPVPGTAAGGDTAVGVLCSAADALAVDLATWEASDPADPSPEARRALRSGIATADAVTSTMSRLRARLEGGRP